MRQLNILMVFALALVLGVAVRADVIELKNGTKVVGKIKDPKADPLVIKTPYGEQSYLRSQVSDVKLCPTPWETFDARMGKVDRRSLDALVDLMEWAHEPDNRKYLRSKLKRLYRMIIRLDKDNGPARRGLGFRKINGQWVSRAEAKRRAKEEAAAKGAADAKRKAEEERKARLRAAETDIGLQMQMNAKVDAVWAKRLSDALTSEMTVGTSKRISISSHLGRDAARPLLELGERAITEVCTDLGLGPKYNPGSAGPRGVFHHYFIKPVDRKSMIDHYRQSHGLSRAFYVYLTKQGKGSGIAAGAGRPAAVTIDRNTNKKDALLHNLGHIIAGSLTGSGNIAPWLQEGYGMYMSIRYLKNTGHFCTTLSKYAETRKVVKKGNESTWAMLAREQVAKGQFPRWVPLSIKKLNLLNQKDLARSWIICKCLMDSRPKDFKRFMQYTGVKREAQDRALRVSLEMQPSQLDDYVNKWIKEKLR